jgi:hypothetical protein
MFDNGVRLPTGPQLVTNTTGEPELVATVDMLERDGDDELPPFWD